MSIIRNISMTSWILRSGFLTRCDGKTLKSALCCKFSEQAPILNTSGISEMGVTFGARFLQKSGCYYPLEHVEMKLYMLSGTASREQLCSSTKSWWIPRSKHFALGSSWLTTRQLIAQRSLNVANKIFYASCRAVS